MATSPSARALVIGAGVSGLSAAHELLREGMSVELWTRDDPTRTTSTVAAALWFPYLVGPAKRVPAWALSSHARFSALAARPETGVRLRQGRELFPDAPDAPAWRAELPGFRTARADELAPGCASGWIYAAPIIETRIYLPWLLSEIERSGARVERRTARSLDEALARADVVVDAAGLGARELAGDRGLIPVRGEILRVEQRGVERFHLDEQRGAVSYVVPRSGDCVLGGTSEPGRSDLEPDPAACASMHARAIALEPRLASSPVISQAVGLRPWRESVRLESERIGSKVVVHDYGHGGAGVTLSWGCAEEVAALVRAELGLYPRSR